MKRLIKIAVIVSGIIALSYLVAFLYYWPFYKQFHTVWIVTDSNGTSEKLFSGGPPFSYDSDAWDMIRERRISGLIRVYQKWTGALKIEFFVKNGKRHGTKKEFFVRSDVNQDSTRGVFEEVGKVALSEIQYRDGQMHGFYIERYQNGMLGGLRSYTNDVEEGFSLMFYDDGRLASIYDDKGNHLKIKYSKIWDEDGNLVEHAFYDDIRNLTGGVVRVGYDGQGKREVYDEVKKQKMTVEDFQKTLADAEKYQPKIWELQKFFSLDPKIIAILDKECSAHTNSHPSESSSQSK
jgi:antitoxin component YwqK of YwqJK toxin-antitoxin module